MRLPLFAGGVHYRSRWFRTDMLICVASISRNRVPNASHANACANVLHASLVIPLEPAPVPIAADVTVVWEIVK